MELLWIVEAIENKRVRITDHADEEMQNDRLHLDEVLDSVKHGEIIEDYPHDKILPSCLIFGTDSHGQPIHTVWGYNKETAWAVLVTAYRPDPSRWEHWRIRKS